MVLDKTTQQDGLVREFRFVYPKTWYNSKFLVFVAHNFRGQNGEIRRSGPLDGNTIPTNDRNEAENLNKDSSTGEEDISSRSETNVPKLNCWQTGNE